MEKHSLGEEVYQWYGRDTKCFVTNTIYSMSKAMGKGKFHGDLSHGLEFKRLRKRANESTIRFERQLGTREGQADFANAMPTLRLLEDTGEWGVRTWLGKLDAKNNGTTRLHRDLVERADNMFVKAALRIMAVLHITVFRPIQTYVQNSRTSVDDMVPVLNEYRALLTKLVALESLNDIPWLGDNPEQGAIEQ